MTDTKAPERIWAGPAVGSKGAPTWDFNGMCPGDCDNDPSGLQYAEHAALYHHADTVTALQAEVDRLREALGKCVNELEATARSEYEGVWHEQDFVDMCAPYRAALNGANT